MAGRGLAKRMRKFITPINKKELHTRSALSLSTRSSMKTQWALLVLASLTIAAHSVNATHFRGGTIHWRPLYTNPAYFDGRV